MAKNKNDDISLISQEGQLRSLLVELREKAGYSISQLADAMCLSEETLAHLENEEFEQLAEPPYIRGYLRNYAKLADSNTDELINCYESLRGADPSALNYHFKTSAKIHTQKTRRVSPIFFQILSFALLVGILAGISMIPSVNQWIKNTWNSFSNQTASKSTTENPLLTGTMPVPAPLSSEASLDTATIIEEKIAKPQTINKPEIDTIVEKNTSNLTEKKPTPDTKSKKPEIEKIIVDTKNPLPKEEARIPATSTDGKINIKLVFNKEVWMRIRDGQKKTLFEGQNPSGQEKVLNLKKPLTFRVGNAQGLSLFVDGKEVDISRYIKGSVANFTLE